MTKEIQETLEVLKETKLKPNKHISQWGNAELTINPNLEQALSTAIGWGEVLEKADKELGEEYEVKYGDEEYPAGYNAMHDIARSILAKAKLEIEYFEEECERSYKETKKWRVDAQQMYKELQLAKKELADIKETHKNIIDEKCAGDEKHCTCVPALREKIKELEEVIKTGKCKHIAEDVLSAECSLCHLAWCELRIKVLEKK